MRIPLYAPLFRRPATVVGYGRHIRNAADLQTECIEGAHRRFSSGAGPLDAHLEILDAALLRCAAGLLGGNLGGERSRFPRALEACGARGRPRRSEEHTSELQSQSNLVCRLLLEKKKN